MPNGYFGKVLWIDLTKDSIYEENIPETYYQQYFGGYGLACRLIYENMAPKVDPLSSKAIIGYFPGLLTGTITPLSGRYMTAGKSPLTNTWGDANSGGYFGPEIKKCGFDGILVKGTSDNPKSFVMIDREKKLVDGSDLWGLDTVQTENRIKNKYGNVKISCIGTAGENISFISGVVTDKGRIAARCGLGAVMGSKKLKALILKGNEKVSVADKDLLLTATKEYNNEMKNSNTITIYKNLGTSGLNVAAGQAGDSPIKNWGGSSIDDFPTENLEKISGQVLNKYKQKEYGCFSCSVQCGAILKVPELEIEETHIPEYETCAAFGHMLLNDDPLSLIKVNDLCNRAGIDTISTGATVAFAIECYENGLLEKNDTDGLELTWGNSKAIIELVKKIINRDGFGHVLADGSKIASEKIGKGSEKFAMHSMGQELAMHDAKFFKSLGMSYAFDPTPGRHTTPSIDIMAIGPLIKPNGLLEGLTLPRKWKRPGDDRYIAQTMMVGLKQATNALGLCEFINIYQKYPLREVIEGVLGWDLSVDEILKVGHRIHTLRQAFTIREGIIMANNELPGKAIGDPPFETGPHRGKTIDYKQDYKGFCEKFGWNPTNGYPLKERLSELELNFVINDLY